MFMMEKTWHFDRQFLDELFTGFTANQAVLQFSTNLARHFKFDDYIARVMINDRIGGGADFIEKNTDVLTYVHEKFSVPPSIVAAILGIESNFGRYMKKNKLFETLATLAFFHPYDKRRSLFQHELETFLLLCKEKSTDPRTIYGGATGEIGSMQFLPSSFSAYAITASGLGTPDLNIELPDAAASIGNYLKAYGWDSIDGPMMTRAIVPKNFSVIKNQVKLTTRQPSISMQALRKLGIQSEHGLPDNEHVGIEMLDTKNTVDRYWIVRKNFYVMLHYNSKVEYAIAVHTLSQAIDNHYHDNVGKSDDTKTCIQDFYMPTHE